MKTILLLFLIIVIFFLPINIYGQVLGPGALHGLVICTDGTIRSWGHNGDGKLGDNSSANRLTAVQVVGITASSVSGGDWHSLALKSDGTVWGWGQNTSGQVGDNTSINPRMTPVQVAGGLAGISQIAAGGSHSLALKTDGSVWAWGLNSSGQLGDGSYPTAQAAPVQVRAGAAAGCGTYLCNITQITACVLSSAALKNDGTVWSWGANQFGGLGDGTSNDAYSPVQVVGLTNVISITAGWKHMLALKSDGSVWAWGYNQYSQLGDGTTTNQTTPVQVNGLTGVQSLAGAGNYHSMAYKSDGTVWGWGRNNVGQLGDNTTTNRSSPVQLFGLSGIVLSTVGTDSNQGFALKTDGSVWAWGQNSTWGALGDGTTAQRNSPVQVINLCYVATVPVELLGFTATPHDNVHVRCDWATASEINNHHFDLERSQDGFNFSQIQQIPSAAVGGNSTIPLYYTRYDYEPFVGLSYYRLKQTDYNGEFNYSPIRPVFIGANDIISIYPNPSFDGLIHYTIGSENGGNVTVEVIDVLGRVLYMNTQTLPKGVSTQQLSTATLSAGNYLLRISTNYQEQVQKQFLVK